jgi:hypothetical protein
VLSCFHHQYLGACLNLCRLNQTYRTSTLSAIQQYVAAHG